MTIFMTLLDDVSGIHIMDDGTKVYWTEGRGSASLLISPNGEMKVIGIGDSEYDEVDKAEAAGSARSREMTDGERKELDWAEDMRNIEETKRSLT